MTTTKSEFLALYQMVLADGFIHPKELEAIYKIGHDTLGLTDEEMSTYIREAGTKSVFQPEIPEDKIAMLYRLAIIAMSDAKLDYRENTLLKRYALYYGVAEDAIDPLCDILFAEAEKGTSEEELINTLKQM